MSSYQKFKLDLGLEKSGNCPFVRLVQWGSGHGVLTVGALIVLYKPQRFKVISAIFSIPVGSALLVGGIYNIAAGSVNFLRAAENLFFSQNLHSSLDEK